MDTEDKKKLNRALEISEENNTMLKALVRSMRWARLFKIVYWGILIAISVGAFYYLQPYVDKASSAYSTFQQGVNRINTYLSPR